MANTADIRGANRARAQEYLAPGVISGLFTRLPLLYFMLFKNGAKEDAVRGIGTPSVRSAFSGMQLKKQRIEEITGAESYMPLLHAIRQTDGKNMSLRDNNPTVSLAGSGAVLVANLTGDVITSVTVSDGGTGYTGTPTINVTDATGTGAFLIPTVASGVITAVTVVNGGSGYTSPTATVQSGASSGERYQRPCFKWWNRRETGIVYNNDIRRAQYQAGNNPARMAAARGSLMSDAMDETLAGHLEILAQYSLMGVPTTQTDPMWDQPSGILHQIHDTTVWGGLDRSLAANAWAKGKRVTTARTANIANEVDDANNKYGCVDKGGGIDLMFAPPDIYQQYKRQLRALNQKIYTEMPKIGSYGFKGEVLQYDNTFIVREALLPAKTVVGLSLDSWMIAFARDKKFTFDGPFDQKQNEGGKDAKIFYLDTELMQVCEAPWLNIVYTNVSVG